MNKLWSFADRIRETEVITNNMPIRYDGNDEIKVLVDSYNDMLFKLKEQSELIVQQEREDLGVGSFCRDGEKAGKR